VGVREGAPCIESVEGRADMVDRGVWRRDDEETRQGVERRAVRWQRQRRAAAGGHRARQPDARRPPPPRAHAPNHLLDTPHSRRSHLNFTSSARAVLQSTCGA
jgi:hypothetical protein